MRGGSAEFSADGRAVGPPQQEDRVGARIGVEGAGLDERIDEFGSQAALLEQIIADAGQLCCASRYSGKISA